MCAKWFEMGRWLKTTAWFKMYLLYHHEERARSHLKAVGLLTLLQTCALRPFSALGECALNKLAYILDARKAVSPQSVHNSSK